MSGKEQPLAREGFEALPDRDALRAIAVIIGAANICSSMLAAQLPETAGTSLACPKAGEQ